MDKEIKVKNSEVSLEKATLRNDAPGGQEALVHTSFEYDRSKSELRSRESKAASRARSLEQTQEMGIPTPSLEVYQSEQQDEPAADASGTLAHGAEMGQKERVSLLEQVIEWMAAAIRRLDYRIFRTKKKVETPSSRTAPAPTMVKRKRRRLKNGIEESDEDPNVEWEAEPPDERSEDEGVAPDQTPPGNLEDELAETKKKEPQKRDPSTRA